MSYARVLNLCGLKKVTFLLWSELIFHLLGVIILGLPGGSDGKESTCNVGDLGLIPGLGRSFGEGKVYSSILAWRMLWTV